MKINIISGYFDPIHDGHIEFMAKSRECCDKMIVILNNDEQAVLKKGAPFMELAVREIILEAIKYVDEIVKSIDSERSVCKTLELIRTKYPEDELCFLNGGDRNNNEIPESGICKELSIKIIDGIGKKINSSRYYYGK